MIRIKTNTSLPVQAVIRGEAEGAMPLCHSESFEGCRVWSYKGIKTMSELEEIKKNPALRGFKAAYAHNDTSSKPSFEFEIDDVVGERTPLKVLFIGDHCNADTFAERGDEVYVISKRNRTYVDTVRYFPLPDSYISVRTDAPEISPASFDLVELSTGELIQASIGFGNWREYAEDLLRCGGIIKIITQAECLVSSSRWLASRFERLAVDTNARGYFNAHATVMYGVKKKQKKYDKNEEEFLRFDGKLSKHPCLLLRAIAF